MPESTLNHGPDAVDPQHADRPYSSESARHFAAERVEESRKRFATYSLWAGLLGLLLLLIPNPVPWLLGPVAIVLGIHALIRIWLQPGRYAGTFRALVGIAMGLVATAACRPWSNVFQYRQQRAVCEANLRAVGLELRRYHTEWGAFPPNLETLIRAGGVTPHQCRCSIEPQAGEAAPDFGYVAGLRPEDPARWPWLIDNPVNHHGRGGIILYLSGATQHLEPDAFDAEWQRFREQYERERGRAPTIVRPD